MLEPVISIAAVLVAFLAGGLAGYFCGRTDERATRLYRKQLKSRYEIAVKSDALLE